MANGGGKRRIEFLVTKGGLPDKFRGGDDPLRSYLSSNLCEPGIGIGLAYSFAVRRKFFFVKHLLTSESKYRVIEKLSSYFVYDSFCHMFALLQKR